MANACVELCDILLDQVMWDSHLMGVKDYPQSVAAAGVGTKFPFFNLIRSIHSMATPGLK